MIPVHRKRQQRQQQPQRQVGSSGYNDTSGAWVTLGVHVHDGNTTTDRDAHTSTCTCTTVASTRAARGSATGTVGARCRPVLSERQPSTWKPSMGSVARGATASQPMCKVVMLGMSKTVLAPIRDHRRGQALWRLAQPRHAVSARGTSIGHAHASATCTQQQPQR